MTDPNPALAIRLGYLSARNIHPDSIPGRACLAGHWDSAPELAKALKETLSRAEEG